MWGGTWIDLAWLAGPFPAALLAASHKGPCRKTGRRMRFKGWAQDLLVGASTQTCTIFVFLFFN